MSIIDEIKRENIVRATEGIAMLPYSALIFRWEPPPGSIKIISD
jgi:hypothetical protein